MKLYIDKYTDKYFMWSKIYKHLIQYECRNLRGFINEITIYLR